MALHFLLRINGDAIGLVNIRRLHDLVPGQPSEYEVRAEYPAGQKHEARVMHDYDDGALVLTQKAVAALVNATDPIAEAEARGYQRAIDALGQLSDEQKAMSDDIEQTARVIRAVKAEALADAAGRLAAEAPARLAAHTAIRSGESTDDDR